MAVEKKETAQRDENGVRKQSYKRFKEGRDYEPTDAETTAALCDAFLTGFLQTEETPEGGEVQNKGGRPRKLETVEEFTEVAEKYILYIKDRAAEGVRLVPDVEGFCSFAGISRETLNNWETARPGAYSDTIKRLKTSHRPRVQAAGPVPRSPHQNRRKRAGVRKSKRKRTAKPHKLYIFISPSVSAGSFPLISTGKRCAISAAVGSSAACLPTFKSIFCAACV
jgi:hypothetical protein